MITPGQGYGGRAEQEAAIAPNRGPATPAGPTPPPSGVPGVPEGHGGAPAGGPAPGAPPTGELPGAFAPTARPGEPPNTLPPARPGYQAQALLGAMFAATGDPWIQALMQEPDPTPVPPPVGPAPGARMPIGLPSLEEIEQEAIPAAPTPVLAPEEAIGPPPATEATPPPDAMPASASPPAPPTAEPML